jgi:hypothetical protein
MPLAQIYEDLAQGCIRSAAKADDPKQRDMLLKHASEWREDAKELLRVAESAPSDAPASGPPQTKRKAKPRPRVKLRNWRERRNKR